jgi:hypothetical protein
MQRNVIAVCMFASLPLLSECSNSSSENTLGLLRGRVVCRCALRPGNLSARPIPSNVITVPADIRDAVLQSLRVQRLRPR